MDRYNACRRPVFDRNGVFAGSIEEPCSSFIEAYNRAECARAALVDALGFGGDECVKVSVRHTGSDRIVEVVLDR